MSKMRKTPLLLILCALAVFPAFGQTVSINTDKPSYLIDDKITISGKIQAIHDKAPISLSVIDPSGNKVYGTEIYPSADGTYEEKLWVRVLLLYDKGGEFEIRAQYGTDEFAKTFHIDDGTPDPFLSPIISINTDKQSYSPGEPVKITVRSVRGGYGIDTLHVLDPDGYLLHERRLFSSLYGGPSEIVTYVHAAKTGEHEIRLTGTSREFNPNGVRPEFTKTFQVLDGDRSLPQPAPRTGESEFLFDYRLQNMVILSAESNPDIASLILHVDVHAPSGMLEVTFEREYFDSVGNHTDRPFIIIADGEDPDYEEVPSYRKSRTLNTELPPGTASVIITGTELDTGTPVPYTGESKKKPGYTMPEWVKEIFGFWAEEKISADELRAALKFLINNGIVVI